MRSNAELSPTQSYLLSDGALAAGLLAEAVAQGDLRGVILQGISHFYWQFAALRYGREGRGVEVRLLASLPFEVHAEITGTTDPAARLRSVSSQKEPAHSDILATSSIVGVRREN
jgi:hypothetical protein